MVKYALKIFEKNLQLMLDISVLMFIAIIIAQLPDREYTK